MCLGVCVWLTRAIDIFLDVAWEQYKSGALAETKERDSQPLGGVRPNSTTSLPGGLVPVISSFGSQGSDSDLRDDGLSGGALVSVPPPSVLASEGGDEAAVPGSLADEDRSPANISRFAPVGASSEHMRFEYNGGGGDGDSDYGTRNLGGLGNDLDGMDEMGRASEGMGGAQRTLDDWDTHNFE